MHRHGMFGALIGLGLAAGVGMVLGRMSAYHHHFAYEAEGKAEEPGEEHRHEFRHGFRHAPWRRGYPPMFEEWHRRMHEQETAEAKPAAEEEKPAAGSAKA